MKIKGNYFTNLANKEEITIANGKKYTVRENRKRFFFPDEWMAFYDKLTDNQKPTFRILVNTGLRINEARHVKVSDIDKTRGIIIIRMTKTRLKDGTRKIRTIKVSNQFNRYLSSLVKQYSLSRDDTFPILSTPGANIAMKKALQGVGIKDWYMFSIHNIRKTLETWLFALDIDSMKVTNHFGHSYRVAEKFYVSGDMFTFQDKQMIRDIIGDLYQK